MRRLLILTLVLMVVPLSAGAGGAGHMSLCSGFATGTEVSMLDSCFDGTAQFAPAGEAITIVNDGSLPHSYTAVDGSFDTGELQPGESYEVAIDDPRVVEVFCTLHGTADGSGMAGVLVVGEAEPLPVSAPANMSVIQQAVADENQPVADALANQSQMISALTTAQARLTEAVDALETGMEPPATGAQELPWTAVAVGAAGGLLLAGVGTFLARRHRPWRVGADPEPGSAL